MHTHNSLGPQYTGTQYPFISYLVLMKILNPQLLLAQVIVSAAAWHLEALIQTGRCSCLFY